MRFMISIKAAETHGAPPRELMQAIDALGAEAMKAGVLVETGGLLPTALGARIRLSNGQIHIKDGPFTEAKEVVGGYAVYDVDSKEEAIEWTKRFMELHRQHWKGFEGEAEIRQIMENPVPQGR